MIKLSNIKTEIFIFILSALLFIPFLGQVHLFDWDEINFAECAREMIVTGDYSLVQKNFAPFWEKPPLFIWMQVLSMKIFGMNEFAARLPNAVCGIVTLVFLYRIGKKINDELFGRLWALAYVGSFLPFLYFKSGIIDPWFNLFIFAGIYQFILFLHYDAATGKVSKRLLFTGLLIGLAVLTKGPVALLITILCISLYALLKFNFRIINIKQALVFLSVVAITGGSYFILLMLQGRYQVVMDFINYQIRLFGTEDAGHGGPFIYHFIVLLIGCFPVSVFALRVMRRSQEQDSPFALLFRRWMLVLFWLVLLLFSIVKTKIVHYSSLCYFPLSYLAASSIYKINNDELAWKKWQTILLTFIGTLLSAVFIAVSFIEKYKIAIIQSGKIKDVFAVENLKASVSWNGYEWIAGVLMITAVVYFVINMVSKKYLRGFVAMLISIVIISATTSIMIAPKIEQYSQGAAIEFYKEKSNKDCRVETYGFKSYAHLFYTNKKSTMSDKTLYMVSKIQHVEEITHNNPTWKELYRKNGFVFWEVK